MSTRYALLGWSWLRRAAGNLLLKYHLSSFWSKCSRHFIHIMLLCFRFPSSFPLQLWNMSLCFPYSNRTYLPSRWSPDWRCRCAVGPGGGGVRDSREKEKTYSDFRDSVPKASNSNYSLRQKYFKCITTLILLTSSGIAISQVNNRE